MTRYGPIRHLGGPLADWHHVFDPATSLGQPLRAREAHPPAGAEVPGQLAAQRAARLHKKAEVDGFVGHLHLGVIGVGPT